MRYIPLLVVPFLLYNAFAFLIFDNYETGFAAATVFTVPMVSGADFSLTVSAAIILMALVLLGFEVVKATRVGATNVADHVLATILFVVYLLEFLLVRQAATSTFLILTAIALVDLLCGFAVSLKSAHRDVTFEG
jgi:hypothetical protein